MLAPQRFASLKLRLEEIFLHHEVDDRQTIKRCAIAALLLLIAVYPDVIFRGASVSAANFVNVTVEPRPERVQIYPERRGREAYHGYYDIGGAAFQSDPGVQFMTRAFWNGQSVFWNPYSATGAYGIETLVDVKTSPLSMTVALLGGSDAVFHLAFLGFSFLGTFCLLLLLTVRWRLSLLAAIAGGIAYLLNGYNVANLGSNVSQTWLYFPILALALVSFASNPRTLSFLGIAAGSTLILATTFLPTTTIILGTTMFVGMVSAFAGAYAHGTPWRPVLVLGGKLVAAQCLGVALGLLLLAVVYLPVFEAMRDMATGEYYGARNFYPATLFNFISLFTPKHVFEAYNAITARADMLRGNVVFHQGIVGALVLTQAVRVWPPFHRIVVGAMGAALLLLLARAYGLPVYSSIVNFLPVVGNLGEQYVWIGIAALFTLLVPFGLQGLIRGGVRLVPLAVGAVVILAALLYTSYLHGIDNFIGWFYVATAVCLVIATAALVVIFRRTTASIVPVVALVALSFVEMTFYVNSYRLSRTDRFLEPPRFVRFLQLNVGLQRVASYGQWGMPPEYGAAYGVAEVGQMTFHWLPRYVELFNRLILPDPADRWTGHITMVRARDADAVNLAAFNMIGTKYLTVPSIYKRLRGFMEQSNWRRAYEDPYYLIFENPNPLRSYVTHSLVSGSATPVDRGQDPRAISVSDDPQLVDMARKLGIASEASEATADEFASITRYEHVRVEIVANLARPGILVLNDAWHANWRARVNGQPHYIGVVNEAFRGLALPAGRHVIEMSYAPRSLLAAKILTGIGLLIAFGLFAARRRIDPLLAHFLALVPRRRKRNIKV